MRAGREVWLVHPPVSGCGVWLAVGCGVWPALPFGRGCGVWLARLPVEDDVVRLVRIPLDASGV